jgi:acetyl esterase/lipase
VSRFAGRLIASSLLAAQTAYALWPARTPGSAAALSLAAAWLPSELPAPLLAVQAARMARAVRSGAWRTGDGRTALVLDGLSVAGLLESERRARRAGASLESALTAGLGADVASGGEANRHGSRSRSRLLATMRVRRRLLHTGDIPYGPHGTANLLDVWRRPDLPADATAPVLVQVPGGAYIAGNKQGQAYPLLSLLVDHGWVCVSLSYRLAPKATWPAQIIDVKRALAWVHAHIAEYGGDPDFVAITGGSAGAQLAALAGVSSGDPFFQPGFEDADTSVQAAVPLYGIYDWTPPELWPAMQAYLMQFGIMSRPYEEDRELYERSSPARRIGAAPPPFFVLHGAYDLFAPAEGARRFVERLRASGGTAVYGELPGAQHAFDFLGSPRAWASARAVARFLEVVRAHRSTRTTGSPDPDGVS